MSILVNGTPTKQFDIRRGLRQGCPLSPFLFNIAAEALSVFCDRAVMNGSFERVTVGTNDVTVTSLQFADDTLIFCKPVVAQLTNVKRLLQCFQLMSGLKINFRKSHFFGFGREIGEAEAWVNNYLCNVGHLPTVYLGLPLGARTNNKVLWSSVIEKLQNRVGSWKAQYLSLGGRITMIKSVLSSLPMYFLSLYKLPVGVRISMEKIMRNFLWGGNEGKRKMHLIKWESVTCPKALGGLGIINLEVQNAALLTKWIWRYGNEAGNLWRQVIDSKTNGNPSRLLPQMADRRKTSFIWKNISQVLSPTNRFSDCCKNMFAPAVGSGNRVLFWHDTWVEGITLKIAFPRIYALANNKEGTINEYGHWQEAKWEWNIELRRDVFDWEVDQWMDLLAILENVYLHQNRDDYLSWRGTTSGKFSVSSFYNCITNPSCIKNPLWNLVWSGLAPPKVEAFCWQIMRGRVAVKAELFRRGMIGESLAQCTFCKKDLETVNHLFFHCSFSWSIWNRCLREMNVVWGCPSDAQLFFLSWSNLPGRNFKESWCMLFFTVIWSLWLFRNQMVFNGSQWDAIQLFNLIKCRYASWFLAKWPTEDVSANDLIRCPEIAPRNRSKAVLRVTTEWKKPCEGYVKFNVDGSALGKPGPAGIGGILRDSTGKSLVIFSKSIGVVDSNAAEFLAIREAFQIFKESRWKDCPLVVESDSKNAVAWVNNPEGIPWRLRNYSNHLSNLKLEIRQWGVVHIYREANKEADELAKQGALGGADTVEIYD